MCGPVQPCARGALIDPLVPVAAQVLVWDLRGAVGASARLGASGHASHALLQVKPQS